MEQELLDWVNHSHDPLALHIREMLRPTLDQLYTVVVDFGRFDHRHIMRRKIRRMVRL